MKFIVAAAALVLCACAPEVDSQTPRSISICYDPVITSGQKIADQAQAHCRAQGLNARQMGGGQCAWGQQRRTFDCVP